MTIQELEREIMALSGKERAELLTRLERRALYDNRNAAMVVVSNDLSEEGAEKPVAEVYKFQMGRQEPHQTIDIFAEIFQEATSVSKPLINAFIRRWELIVRNKHRFSDKFSRFAIRHLEHVGQVMAEGAKQRATPIEHVVAEDIHQDEFYYLKYVHDMLLDRKIKRIKSWKTKCNLIEKRLRKKSAEVLSEIERRYEDDFNSPLPSPLSESARLKAKASGLRSHKNHHHQVIKGILKFLFSDLCPSSNREDAWRNAYIAWRVGIATATAKEYLSKLRRDAKDGRVDDITEAVLLHGRGWLSEESWCAEMFSFQLPWVEILKNDLQ